MKRLAACAASVCLASLVAAACGGDDNDTTGTTSAAAPPTTEVSVGGVSTTAPAGREPVREAIAWFVALLEGADLDEAEYAAHFAASFRSDVGLADFTPGLAQVRDTADGPWTVDAVEVDDTGLAATFVVRSGATALDMKIAVEQESPHRIELLSIAPATLDVALRSLDEIQGRLEELAPKSGLLVAEVVDGTCEAVTEVRPDDRLPIGSAVKLYVLGAVGQAVIDGRLAWDDPVTIRDELDSLPSGTTQDEPAGSTLTVEELALRMISVSDNTATDHLIDLVGREEVEAALGSMGHGDPSVNMPFLTTRELFFLKLALDGEERAGYVASTTDERRAFLSAFADRSVAELVLPSGNDPVDPDTLEWFASPADLCRALAALNGLAGQPGGEPIREILGANPGMEVDPATFSYVGFKGGSEPGVVAVAWLLERTDGHLFAFIGAALDTESELDSAVLATFLAGVEFVGTA